MSGVYTTNNKTNCKQSFKIIKCRGNGCHTRPWKVFRKRTRCSGSASWGNTNILTHIFVVVFRTERVLQPRKVVAGEGLVQLLTLSLVLASGLQRVTCARHVAHLVCNSNHVRLLIGERVTLLTLHIAAHRSWAAGEACASSWTSSF